VLIYRTMPVVFLLPSALTKGPNKNLEGNKDLVLTLDGTQWRSKLLSELISQSAVAVHAYDVKCPSSTFCEVGGIYSFSERSYSYSGNVNHVFVSTSDGTRWSLQTLLS